MSRSSELAHCAAINMNVKYTNAKSTNEKKKKNSFSRMSSVSPFIFVILSVEGCVQCLVCEHAVKDRLGFARSVGCERARPRLQIIIQASTGKSVSTIPPASILHVHKVTLGPISEQNVCHQQP